MAFCFSRLVISFNFKTIVIKAFLLGVTSCCFSFLDLIDNWLVLIDFEITLAEGRLKLGIIEFVLLCWHLIIFYVKLSLVIDILKEIKDAKSETFLFNAREVAFLALGVGADAELSFERLNLFIVIVDGLYILTPPAVRVL